MSNLTKIFENKKVFIPFVVANDPDFDTTVENIITLAKNGADIVELGIPFSDPVADGPVIQSADLRAFKAGVTTERVFEIISEVRKHSDIPLVLLSYLNIPFKYGYEKFLKRCADLNISGIVIPDLPLESRDEIAPIANDYDIDIIPLITPTSGHRIKEIAEAASGFIYVVSSLGITGQRDNFSEHLADLITNIRKYTDVPTAIGFGIHTPKQATSMAKIADGVIVGSAFVDIIGKQGRNSETELANLAKEIATAIK
ncbi:tryptophan synthase subunit alpha [Lentilactobacillus sp. SPB1-3]|uniref:Tryptophan synthase subunit alpha n=1 Tax=Lentilactobacillus terminaliae TaxID=3003483 RepID=A0ACD5DF16_9LACO|nr:tryptophan synthase subunit alpha [Lentilactobacillus sp. SPB1-3]MCZ0976261.1 tryptophan synthase subunit alpha [Lentilactobacillus sp. SPB1-3]